VEIAMIASWRSGAWPCAVPTCLRSLTLTLMLALSPRRRCSRWFCQPTPHGAARNARRGNGSRRRLAATSSRRAAVLSSAGRDGHPRPEPSTA
jgi:hypothetical protein